MRRSGGRKRLRPRRPLRLRNGVARLRPLARRARERESFEGLQLIVDFSPLLVAAARRRRPAGGGERAAITNWQVLARGEWASDATDPIMCTELGEGGEEGGCGCQAAATKVRSPPRDKIPSPSCHKQHKLDYFALVTSVLSFISKT